MSLMKAKQLSGGISVSTCNPSLVGVCVMATEGSSESAVRAHGGEERRRQRTLFFECRPKVEIIRYVLLMTGDCSLGVDP